MKKVVIAFILSILIPIVIFGYIGAICSFSTHLSAHLHTSGIIAKTNLNYYAGVIKCFFLISPLIFIAALSVMHFNAQCNK